MLDYIGEWEDIPAEQLQPPFAGGGHGCIKTQRATAMKQPVGRLSRYDPSRKSRSTAGRVQRAVSEGNRKNLTID